jgi:hypothetical protein
MLGLLLIPAVYKGTPAVDHIFQSGLLLELMTVFLLTSAILLLGASNKINAEVLGTLIGGISGYVLGKGKSRLDDRQK